MSLTGQKLNHEPQELPKGAVFTFTDADKEAEVASAAAFHKFENLQAAGQVAFHGVERAGDTTVVDLPQAETEPADPQSVSPDHQIPA